MVRIVRFVGRFRTAIGDGRAYAALAMALVTLLATVVAALQSDAAIYTGRLERNAELRSVSAISTDVGRVVQQGTDLAVFRSWYEQLERAGWAADRAKVVEDAERFESISSVEYGLVDWIASNSALLQAPYYDAETFMTDFGAYYAEQQVEPTTRTKLLVETELETANGWDSKQQTYVTVLTVLAAALFFLGLSVTVSGRSRRLFLSAGTSFALISVVWTGLLAATPVHVTPPRAIDSVVVARSQIARVDTSQKLALSDDNLAHYDAAIAAADAAVAADPNFGQALLAAAESRAFAANARYFATDGDRAAIDPLLDRAIADFAAYLELRPDDYTAAWNMGWAQLLNGESAAARASTERAIAIAPQQFVLYLNHALTYVAEDNAEAAQSDVQKALEIAAASDLASTASFFGEVDYNLGRLQQLWPEHSDLLAELSAQIRSGSVAVTVLDQATAPADAPAAELFVASLEIDDTGEMQLVEGIAPDSSHPSTDIVGYRTLITAPQMEEGRTISLRVWIDGIADTTYSVDRLWQPLEGQMVIDLVSPYGRAGSDVDAGNYHVEMYVDGARRAEQDWTVAATE